MKDLVADYDRSVTERRNFGRTEADLIAQLIQDRDDLQKTIRLKDNKLSELEEDYDKAISKCCDRKAKLRMVWTRLDFIIDEIPYQNRTKKETQNMILEVMKQIAEYLKEE